MWDLASRKELNKAKRSWEELYLSHKERYGSDDVTALAALPDGERALSGDNLG